VPEVSVHGLVFLGNLEESIDFPMKYGGFVQNFPETNPVIVDGK
jgi:hypothetical protein